MTPTLQEALRRAIVSHRAGNLADAEGLYKAILSERPDQFDALLYLGVLESQRGRHEQALKLISDAARINPHSAEAYSSLGNTLHALNRFDEALTSYDRALTLRPDYASAWNSRGAALASLNRLAEAIASYDSALAIKPDYADALSNRGVALEASNRLDDAVTSYDMALKINPRHALALNNRGNALQHLARYEEALESYDRAIAINPHYPDALNNRGNALQGLDRLEEAISSYDKALAIKPDFASAFNHRGKALLALERNEEALDSCERALMYQPRFADAWNNRGLAFAALGRYTEALASYDKALEIEPTCLAAMNNQGITFEALNRHEKALASYQSALAINPDFADALYNRGNTLQALDRLDGAIASYEKALVLKPDYADALNARGNALQSLNRHAEALDSYEQALAIQPGHPYAKWMLLFEKMQCCAWRDHEADMQWVVNEVRSEQRVATPFALFALLSATQSARDQLVCAKTYVREEISEIPSHQWRGDKYVHDRIRLAYLSADFRDHATAFLMAELFERHDSTRFEVTAVSFGPSTRSEMRSRLEAAFERFSDVGNKSDREVATILRELEIDIAIDLQGYTKGCRPRILAYRPVPIQVNYLGYPGTMGADYIDYVVADRYVIPEDHQAHYAEKVVYLPDTYQANDRRRRIAETTVTRVEAGLPEKGFVFCSFNNNFKITPAVFETWMRLLSKVGGSVLWLLEGNAAAPDNLRREAMSKGVAPERLVFAARLEPPEHLARHRLADLFLDTLPYNAHTTASDALWTGLPVLTCLGTTFPGRVAGSLLNAIGLPELITDSLQEYEALALRLATDQKMLLEIKQRLAHNRETLPLFDTDRFRRHIEAAYVSMWERYQRGEPPASFAVSPIDQ